MKTSEYIDMARPLAKTPSDYAVAKLLGISEDAVHGYRKGTRVMDNMTCLRLSELLGLPLEELIADAEIERAKDELTREKWLQRRKIPGASAAHVAGIIVLAALGAIGAMPTKASTLSTNSVSMPTSDTLTIMRHFRRTVRRLAAMGAAQVTAWRLWRLLPEPVWQEHPAL